MAARLALLDWTFQFWPEILDRAAQFIPEVTVTADLTIAEQMAEASAAEQRDLARFVPVLADWGIPLVAISPQTPGGSLSTKETRELTFAVLSDPGNQIAGQLGNLTAPGDGAHAAHTQTVG